MQVVRHCGSVARRRRRCETGRMARTTARSALGSVVGWVLVVLVLLWVVRFVLGSLFWLLRTAIFLVVIVVLLGAYLKLKAPDVDD